MSLDEKPLEAIAKKTRESSDEEREEGREGNTREKPTTPVKNLVEIKCDGEIVELKLRYLELAIRAVLLGRAGPT